MWISKMKIHNDLNIITYVWTKMGTEKYRWKHTRWKFTRTANRKFWRLHKIAAMQLPQFSIDERNTSTERVNEQTGRKRKIEKTIYIYISFDVFNFVSIFYFSANFSNDQAIHIKCKMTCFPFVFNYFEWFWATWSEHILIRCKSRTTIYEIGKHKKNIHCVKSTQLPWTLTLMRLKLNWSYILVWLCRTWRCDCL